MPPFRYTNAVPMAQALLGGRGGSELPHMERGTALRSPNRNVLRYTVSIKPAWLGCHHAPRLSVCRTRTRRSGGYPFEQFETGLADKAKGGGRPGARIAHPGIAPCQGCARELPCRVAPASPVG